MKSNILFDWRGGGGGGGDGGGGSVNASASTQPSSVPHIYMNGLLNSLRASQPASQPSINFECIEMLLTIIIFTATIDGSAIFIISRQAFRSVEIGVCSGV